jgi:hypothetical protein
MECPVCKNGNATSNGTSPLIIECTSCGTFKISDTLLANREFCELNAENRAKLSHWLRKQWDSRKKQEFVVLTRLLLDNILREPLPSVSEQADLLIKHIAERTLEPGEPVCFPFNDFPLIGIISEKGFHFVVEYLKKSDFLFLQKTAGSISTNLFDKYILSVKGWERYREIQNASVSYRKAFMAMKFANEALCDILQNVFKPCVKQAGFDLFRLDEAPKAGLIDDNMRVSIRTSDFVISDLSDDNPGAYWEAGYAEGLGKTVIYTCEKEKFEKEKPHFDTNHHLTIIWDKENPQEAGEKLKATIRATLPHLAKMQDD